MTREESWEEVDGALAGLRVHDAEPDRVERIRARCVAVLAQRRRVSAPARPRVASAWLEPAIAIGVSALYLAAAVQTALAILR
jgi:hypothetical protein